MLIDSQRHKDKYSFWVKLASGFALFAALTMIMVKTWAWYVSDSAAMLASLTDSFFDVTASLINFFVLRYALAPADDDHRFGHGKAESLAGLAQAAFILGSATLLIFHGVDRLKNPVVIDQHWYAVYATIFSVVMTLSLVFVQKLAISKTNSVAIKADSLHYQSDLFMNLAVLIALGLSANGYLSVDGWFAIGIALYLMLGAKNIALQAADTLMDKELPLQFSKKLEEIIVTHPEVYGMHDLRTRQSGRTIFVQFHVELNDHLTLLEAYVISNQIESSIHQKFPEVEVLIHQDPVSMADK